MSAQPDGHVGIQASAPIDLDSVVRVRGQGTRLRPVTFSAAKPMLPTAGVPFREHLPSRILR